MKNYPMPDSRGYARMNTQELRDTFLVDGLFKPGELVTVAIDADRAIAGSAVPLRQPLALAAAEELRAAYFLERRELGILQTGGPGQVVVDGKTYEMDNLDCLYVSRGSRDVQFSSIDPQRPAQFYLLSYPAHAAYPTMLARKADSAAVPLGKQETLNQRTIYKSIHPDGIKSCQLVMGFTLLAAGSGWNTMPPHTHARRSEVYLYFNLDPAARVFHFMGPPQETRHLVMADRQLAISPSWSIHAGVGTMNYGFCWGMGGENQVFDDMDAAPIVTLK